MNSDAAEPAGGAVLQHGGFEPPPPEEEGEGGGADAVRASERDIPPRREARGPFPRDAVKLRRRFFVRHHGRCHISRSIRRTPAERAPGKASVSSEAPIEPAPRPALTEPDPQPALAELLEETQPAEGAEPGRVKRAAAGTRNHGAHHYSGKNRLSR